MPACGDDGRTTVRDQVDRPPDLDAAETDAAIVDMLLAEIADQPVDTSDPDWAAKLAASDPLGEIGAKAEAHAALDVLLDAYEQGPQETRAEVRRILRTYRRFSWGVGLAPEWTTVTEFRRHLIYLSARDQGQDARDELMTLWALCNEARAKGIDVEPLLTEVAALSSEVDHYGMGSMRSLLMRGRENTH